MSHRYAFSDLKLLGMYEIEETYHLTYDLPASIPWLIHHYVDGDTWRHQMHQVSRVRIFLTTDEFTSSPYAGLVPFDEEGREHPVMALKFPGACSVIAVLSRMGFEPILASN